MEERDELSLNSALQKQNSECISNTLENWLQMLEEVKRKPEPGRLECGSCVVERLPSKREDVGSFLSSRIRKPELERRRYKQWTCLSCVGQCDNQMRNRMKESRVSWEYMSHSSHSAPKHQRPLDAPKILRSGHRNERNI